VKRRLFTMLAALALVLTFVPNVAAASYGSCGTSGAAAYHSGEDPLGTRDGIKASMEVFRWTHQEFYPCTPNDNAGINASASIIGMSASVLWTSAWLEFGVMACNHTNNGAWPFGLCNGQPKLFVEQHGAAFWDYNMWDLGEIADDNAHTYQILYNHSSGNYDISFDGTVQMSVNMGNGLVPTAQNTFYWLSETQDAGDGLGTVTYADNIGQMQTKVNGGSWSYHPVGSSCDATSSQQHCVVNGANGIYTYTTN